VDAERVDVSTGNRTGIDFSLNIGNSISGRITIPAGDTAYHLLWVNAWSDQTAMGNGSPVKHDGTYQIVGLTPGAGYKVGVWSDNYVNVFYKSGSGNQTSIDWNNVTEIDISLDNATNIDMTLRAGVNISGTVYLPTGDPAVGVWVDARSSSTSAWGGAETASDGTYSIGGLVAGSDYVVTAWPRQYLRDFQTGVSTGDTVDLTLSTGVSISGHLQNVTGGIGEIWIEAWSEQLGMGSWAMTDNTVPNVGDFTISGLAPNTTYTLSAMAGVNGFVSLDVVVGASDVAGVVLSITAMSAVSGTVNIAGGGVITGVEVIVTAFDASNGTFYNSTTVDPSDGTYTLNLPDNSTYRVLARAQGYSDLWFDGASGAATYAVATDVVPGTGGVDFALVTQ